MIPDLKWLLADLFCLTECDVESYQPPSATWDATQNAQCSGN